MKHSYIKLLLLLFLASCMLLAASCAQLTAEETEKERAYYEEKYASEPAPSPLVEKVLAHLDTCVGGQYVYSAQGDLITQPFIDRVYDIYPEYFSDGRLKYFEGIASDNTQHAVYPDGYAWDCSGLWWDCCNKLELYESYTDRTAHDTYHEDCTPISKDELQPGDLVFLEDDNGRIVHMGIVGQKGYIYEAASSFIGVVKKRTVDKRLYNDIIRGGVLYHKPWNVFGRPKIFE